MAELHTDNVDLASERKSTQGAGANGRCAASVTTRMDRRDGGWSFAPILSRNSRSSGDLCKNSAMRKRRADRTNNLQ